VTAVSLSEVSVRFSSSSGSVVALERTSLDVESNEIVSVVGPSGCGKTTLLNLVAGFLAPTAGSVLLDGVPSGPPSADRAVVFQADAVFPWLTVRQNLEYGPRVRGLRSEAYRDRVDHFLEKVGLTQFAEAFPKTLSGGMRKRVDLARAYVSNPKVLLMDEPFGALDVFTKEAMWRVLGDILEEERKTVIFVTHDIEEAIIVSDRVVAMTPRPAKVAAEVPVPFPFPRPLELRSSPEFQGMRQRLSAILAEQVL
jgi:NitT/TauT family transport system ATP-binding protein